MRAPFNTTIDVYAGPAFGNVLKARGVPARFITVQKHVTDSFSPLIPYYMTMPSGVPVRGSESVDDGAFDFRIGDRLYDSFTGASLMVVSWVETWLPGSTREYIKARGKLDDVFFRGGGAGGGNLVVTGPLILRGGGTGGGEQVSRMVNVGGGTGGGELLIHEVFRGGGTGGALIYYRETFVGGGTGGGATIAIPSFTGGGTGGGNTDPLAKTSGGGTGGGSLS